MLAEADLTGRRRTHRAPRPRRRDAERFFDDLAVGDFVVHHQHGVARYGGMVKRAIAGVERDYLLLEYRGDDKLYVPSDQIDAVRHYTGGEEPSLNRLGGDGWAKTKARVRAATQAIAQELVVLYQKRVNSPGHAFAADTPWQQEMEDAFPYAETPDQLKAIEDVKDDMEASRPMDRLVCGDVGFGKTEVAIRAVFKAVQDGKQAAVLVPTTLLASQHFQTFADRFAGFPVRVEVLSRFLTPGEAKKVVEGLRSGEVDVVIGTHRLLSEDITFKDLGLLVVDEEQRFGVTHKEKIKALRHDVDVLTLTATPIPRTLEMSLTGIRDLTLLHTPPAERQPILTYVGEDDDRAVAEAIRRELLREGQVFFVHNRVQDIDQAADRVRELVPEARVAVAHGQMDEGSLEKVVLRLLGGPVRRAGLHHDHRERHRHADGQHADRRPGRPPRPRPAPPAAGPGGPQRAAGLRLPLPPAEPGAVARRPTSGSRPSARPPSSAPASRSPCATSRSAAPGRSSARARAATSPRSATTSTSRWSTRPSPS